MEVQAFLYKKSTECFNYLQIVVADGRMSFMGHF